MKGLCGAALAAMLAGAPAVAQVPPVYTPQSPPAPLPAPQPSVPQPAVPQPPGAQSPGAPPPAAPPAPEQWLPRGEFELRALDKVDARSLTLTGRVGQSVKYGSLTITVIACVVRPPDEPADAAAFLVIVDSVQNAPGFRGWMFENEPALNMLEHPLYDIRLAACRP